MPDDIGRRLWLGIGATLLVAACSPGGPDQAEALAQIADRLRATFGPGEKRLENLTWKSGEDSGGGRYTVVVEYDLVSTMSEIGMFNTQLKSGDRSHVAGERYVFVKSSTGWALE